MRFRVEARPEGSDLILYLTKVPREKHDGRFTESFADRLTWSRAETARKAIDQTIDRGPNRVHGPLIFRIVEEHGDSEP